MDWNSLRRSTNVEDRRGGLGGGLAIGGGGALLLALLGALFGFNPGDILGNSGEQTSQYQSTPENDAQADFVGRVLGDTEDVWGSIFQKAGREYTPPTLVLFDGQTTAGCGLADSATGPFYCPADQNVYLDLSFFRTLENRLGAGGDFARAYVISHEIGHHVQRELGIEQQVRERQQAAGRAGANALSVRLELQADCFAGVWGHSAAQRGVIDTTDVREAIDAAEAIGDDRLSGGRATPDSFTHGTSAQRATWFTRGLKSGNPDDCNTFAAQ